MHVRVNDVSREVDAQTDADDQNGAGHGVDFKIWNLKKKIILTQQSTNLYIWKRIIIYLSNQLTNKTKKWLQLNV